MAAVGHPHSVLLADITGPQLRGTGGTLIQVWTGHRDSGQPPAVGHPTHATKKAAWMGRTVSWSQFIPTLPASPGRICFSSQALEIGEEPAGLSLEESHRRQEIDHGHGNARCFCRPNYRARWELATKEGARFRHNQIGLERLATERRGVQVRKGHRYAGFWIDSGKWQSISRLVLPGLEVHRLGGPDADQYAQNLDTCGSLRHPWIEAVSPLLDGWHVETRRICNSLKKVWIGDIVVCPWYCGMFTLKQGGDGLRENEVWIEVRVIGIAAITGPPTRVECELHQVRQSHFAARAGCGAALERTEPFEIGRCFSFRHEIGIQEILMRKFIICIVVNVLGHV